VSEVHLPGADVSERVEAGAVEMDADQPHAIAVAAESEVDVNMAPPEPVQPNQLSLQVDDPGISAQTLAQFQNFLRYYDDGIRFCKQISDAIPTMCELLSSNTKSEAVEAMRFFVEAFTHGMEAAEVSFSSCMTGCCVSH
jgi:hypothetical protein